MINTESLLKMFDKEKLISLVKERPELWDGNSRGYTVTKWKKFKEKLWEEVAKEMLEETWHVISDKQRKIQVIRTQGKWKTIRDTYVRRLKKVPENDNGTFFKEHENLSFLHDVDTIRSKKRMIALSDDGEDDNAEIMCKREPPFVWEVHNEDSSVSTSDQKYDVTGHEDMNMAEHPAVSYEELDEDKNFLLSIVPKMRRLSEPQKLDFQMYVLQYFVNLYGNTAE